MNPRLLAFMLDGNWPYTPNLVYSATYWAPAMAITMGWVLVRRDRNKAAWAVAIAAALIVGWPAPFAIRHAGYYLAQEWLTVSFAALFPFVCVARYVCAHGRDPAVPPAR